MAGIPRVLLERYEVGAPLAGGGAVEVRAGRDRLLDRRVVIRVLVGQFGRDPAFLARFERDARAAASLSHPNVIALYDAGVEDGIAFLVEEHVDGSTLRELLRAEGPPPPRRAAELASQVAAALAAAHARGLVHGGLEPGVIMVTSGWRAKVTGFAVGRPAPGGAVADARYVSPEQALGQPVDRRSDLYSLGCVLYELLTGTAPFTGATPVTILYQHVREDPTPPGVLNPELPAELEAVTMTALAKAPGNRYQTADELRHDLEAALAGRAVAGATTPPPLTQRPAEPAPAESVRVQRPQPPPPRPPTPGRRPAGPPRGRGFRIRLPLPWRRRPRSAPPARPAPERAAPPARPGRPTPVERVAFTAAHPGVATPRVWYSLSVYVHLGRLQAAVDERIAARSDQLGLAPAVSTATPFAPLRRGTTLRVVPEVPGVSFNPEFQDVAWLEDLQELSFRLRAAPEAAGRALLGAVAVHAGPLLVAQVPLSIRVRGAGEPEQAAEPATATAQLFGKVFASYAHEDDRVVRAFAEAYRALGIDVLVDKASLHAGERWQERLLLLIEDADLFQLFWSDAASRSAAVAEEWGHALSLQGRKGERFIRPVYWQTPWPPPPSPLAHLHFAALDLSALSHVAGR